MRAAFPGCEIPQAIDGPALTGAKPLDRDDCGPSASDATEGEAALWLVLKQSEATKIVRALENGHAYEVIAILKSQPWWPELSAAARTCSHRPVAGRTGTSHSDVATIFPR